MVSVVVEHPVHAWEAEDLRWFQAIDRVRRRPGGWAVRTVDVRTSGFATGEIDVMEVLGGANPLCWHFHYTGGAPGRCATVSNPAGWHTFGADWQPKSIAFYYDGAKVGRISQGVTSAPMYLIVNLAISTQGRPAVGSGEGERRLRARLAAALTSS